jgi:hypothetical protein
MVKQQKPTKQRRGLGKDKGSKSAKRLLLISNGLANYEDLVRATRDPVTVVVVKYDSWSLANLEKALLSRCKKPSHQYASVGLMDHGSPGHFNLLKKVNKKGVGVRDIHKNKALASFLKKLAKYVKPPKKLGKWQNDHHSRIDLLGCNVAAGSGGTNVLNTLEKLTKVNWTASSNTAGNPSSQADWVQETDKHLGSISPCYFSPQKLKSWHGTLTNIQANGMVFNFDLGHLFG